MTVGPGKTLAHYKIIECIGEGGMGAVYLAEDTRLGRRIALKVLPPRFADRVERRERFEREAKAVATLNHPNIVTLHSVEQSGGTHFLTMELVEGDPLSSTIPRGGVDLDRFFGIALPLVDALRAAHEKGITHRDLKPDNIMVDREGRVRILDFGLAKLQESGPSEVENSALPTATGEGRIVGTVAYMSPEQAQGQPVDHRTDIFSTGIILYQLATGERPFQGENSISMISSIVKDLPPPVHERKPMLPNHLGRIIRRCLEKDRERRYQRALDLYHELEDLRDELRKARILEAAGTAVPVRSGRRGWPLGIGLGALAILLAGWWIQFGPIRKEGSAPPPAISSFPASPASIAVMPFVNMSTDAENEYFADGMTEELINGLVKLEKLKVPSRTTVFTYKGKSLKTGEIGRQLGVRHVLEGSVRRSGNRLRVTAQLIDVTNDFHLWSETFEREMVDVFSIQDEITRAIVDRLKVRLAGTDSGRLVDHPTANLNAYDLYLQGRFELNRHTEESLYQAIDLFERAVATDPGYAPAWTGIADGYFELSSWYRPPHEMMPKAKEAALRALEIDDSLAEAHSRLANIHLIYDWDWEKAEEGYLRAIRLNPRSGMTHASYGSLLAARGRMEEAVSEARLAHRLDPHSNGVNYVSTLVLYMARKYDEAIEMAQRSLELNPEAHLPRSTMVLAYERLGKYREAITEGRELTRYDPSPLLKTFLIYSIGRSGEKLAAETLLEELIETTRARYVCPYEIALCYIGIDDPDAALLWFERAYEARADCWIWGNIDPRLDDMRQDPRFRDLLRRVGHHVLEE